jgi:phage host-nuclease inhibitor protein Gam
MTTATKKKKTRITAQDIALSEEDVQRLVGEISANVVELDKRVAALNVDLDKVRAKHEPQITRLQNEIEEKSRQVEAWGVKNKSERFTERRSCTYARGEIGFRLGQWTVKTMKGVTLKEVAKRLQKFRWGKPYLKVPAPSVNKEELLKNRTKLSEERLLALGITFVQEDRFYIEPKSDQAPTVAVKG